MGLLKTALPYNAYHSLMEFMHHDTYNIYDKKMANVEQWEKEDKPFRWMDSLDRDDFFNVGRVISRIKELVGNSFIAHGSTTYGKKHYQDIDLVLCSKNKDNYRKLHEDLSNIWKYEGVELLLLHEKDNLEDDYVLEVNTYKPKNGKKIQVANLLIKEHENYFPALDSGKTLINIFRTTQKPYVVLILDDERYVG